jgi:hypothetical protein
LFSKSIYGNKKRTIAIEKFFSDFLGIGREKLSVAELLG